MAMKESKDTMMDTFFGKNHIPQALTQLEDNLAHRVLSVLRGLRQGLYYGTKIRMPHALVMTVLFSSNQSLRDMAKRVFALTFQHARNLASFVLVYKTLLSLGRAGYDVAGLKITSKPGRPAHHSHAFIAGAVGGWCVWANYSSVNWQINLYLFSRIISALFKLLAKKKINPFVNYSLKQVYPYFATGVWATVLWLFEYHPELLHKSLKRSMDELYHHSNKWNSVKNFLPTPATSLTLAFMVYMTSKANTTGNLFDLSVTRFFK